MKKITKIRLHLLFHEYTPKQYAGQMWYWELIGRLEKELGLE